MTALFLAAAAYATFVTGILPRWTGWLACAATVLCLACIPAMYVGAVDSTRNAGGWGAAIIANFPPLLWFLAAGVLLVRRRRTIP